MIVSSYIWDVIVLSSHHRIIAMQCFKWNKKKCQLLCHIHGAFSTLHLVSASNSIFDAMEKWFFLRNRETTSTATTRKSVFPRNKGNWVNRVVHLKVVKLSIVFCRILLVLSTLREIFTNQFYGTWRQNPFRRQKHLLVVFGVFDGEKVFRVLLSTRVLDGQMRTRNFTFGCVLVWRFSYNFDDKEWAHCYYVFIFMCSMFIVWSQRQMHTL